MNSPPILNLSKGGDWAALQSSVLGEIIASGPTYRATPRPQSTSGPSNPFVVGARVCSPEFNILASPTPCPEEVSDAAEVILRDLAAAVECTTTEGDRNPQQLKAALSNAILHTAALFRTQPPTDFAYSLPSAAYSPTTAPVPCDGNNSVASVTELLQRLEVSAKEKSSPAEARAQKVPSLSISAPRPAPSEPHPLTPLSNQSTRVAPPSAASEHAGESSGSPLAHVKHANQKANKHAVSMSVGTPPMVVVCHMCGADCDAAAQMHFESRADADPSESSLPCLTLEAVSSMTSPGSGPKDDHRPISPNAQRPGPKPKAFGARRRSKDSDRATETPPPDQRVSVDPSVMHLAAIPKSAGVRSAANSIFSVMSQRMSAVVGGRQANLHGDNVWVPLADQPAHLCLDSGNMSISAAESTASVVSPEQNPHSACKNPTKGTLMSKEHMEHSPTEPCTELCDATALLYPDESGFALGASDVGALALRYAPHRLITLDDAQVLIRTLNTRSLSACNATLLCRALAFSAEEHESNRELLGIDANGVVALVSIVQKFPADAAACEAAFSALLNISCSPRALYHVAAALREVKFEPLINCLWRFCRHPAGLRSAFSLAYNLSIADMLNGAEELHAAGCTRYFIDATDAMSDIDANVTGVGFSVLVNMARLPDVVAELVEANIHCTIVRAFRRWLLYESTILWASTLIDCIARPPRLGSQVDWIPSAQASTFLNGVVEFWGLPHLVSCLLRWSDALDRDNVNDRDLHSAAMADFSRHTAVLIGLGRAIQSLSGVEGVRAKFLQLQVAPRLLSILSAALSVEASALVVVVLAAFSSLFHDAKIRNSIVSIGGLEDLEATLKICKHMAHQGSDAYKQALHAATAAVLVLMNDECIKDRVVADGMLPEIISIPSILS